MRKVILALGFIAVGAIAQDTAEVSSKESVATFSARVNIVTVPVVVRDRNSNPVGTFKKEDFQIFDNGKPQLIGRFSVEKNGVSAANGTPNAPTLPSTELAAPGEAAGKGPSIPDRFLAFIFDDLHLEFADLAQARKAVLPYLSPEKAGSNTRVALFTTSGLDIVDFTDDLEKLRADLNQIRPQRRIIGSSGSNCPPYISPYVADQILNMNNSSAIQAIAAEDTACLGGPPPTVSPQQVEGEARQVLSSAEVETHTTMGVLRNIVRRMAGMPGQRTAVLVSPGFLLTSFRFDLTELINLAVRQNVVVNTLDARGLYTDATLDASRASHLSSVATILNGLDRDEQLVTGEVLGEIADGTGGTWFHNNNDLGEGFRRTTAAPEVYYVLAYSAGDLKNDGRFHKIKVVLKEAKGYTVQARRGYYAPNKKTNEADQVKEDIESAVFSRDEVHTIPITMHTQFFKTTDTAAKLSVITHIDLAHVRFRKADGRSSDNLVVISALFDNNGSYVTANQESLELHLKDEHLEARLKSGVTLKSNFDVKPGAYLVRLVVRDTEGQEIASTNGSVEIP